MNMKTAYLIYRPVMDYEESMEPHFVCSTKKLAERVLAKIRKWGDKAVANIPEWTDADKDSPEYDKVFDARYAYVNALKGPFGIDFRHSDIGVYTTSFPHRCVEMMELNVNPKDSQP